MTRPTPPFAPQILTASDLLDGEVIYETGNQTWSTRISHAHLYEDAAMAARALAQANAQPNRILGAYLSDAGLDTDGLPVPKHFREKIRAAGPSNRFHGKQADLAR